MTEKKQDILFFVMMGVLTVIVIALEVTGVVGAIMGENWQ